jgi:hypothetical protein
MCTFPAQLDSPVESSHPFPNAHPYLQSRFRAVRYRQERLQVRQGLCHVPQRLIRLGQGTARLPFAHLDRTQDGITTSFNDSFLKKHDASIILQVCTAVSTTFLSDSHCGGRRSCRWADFPEQLTLPLSRNPVFDVTLFLCQSFSCPSQSFYVTLFNFHTPFLSVFLSLRDSV